MASNPFLELMRCSAGALRLEPERMFIKWCLSNKVATPCKSELLRQSDMRFLAPALQTSII